MKITLDWRKTVQENANHCYSLAKELAKKQEGARRAINETDGQLAQAHEKKAAATESKAQPIMRRKREWFEKFRWFYTSGGKLVIAGRDAKQNDLLVSKMMDDSDLFFHADIQGAPATILKGGKGAGEEEKGEAAQFAASHSSAWKTGAAAVDVYAVGKEQLAKHAQGGFVGAGGFAITGEREWFRDTPLGIAMGEKDGAVLCFPERHPDSKKMKIDVRMGFVEKGKAAKMIAHLLNASIDEVLAALPSGKFAVKEKK